MTPKALLVFWLTSSAPAAFAATATDAAFGWEWDKAGGPDATAFELACCHPAGCRTYVVEGSARAAEAHIVATVAGSAKCAVKALNGTVESAPSNEVIWERPSTGAPPNARVLE